MDIYRILILSGTFFMVGLCPHLTAAVAVFTAGMAVYSFLWLWELCSRKKK